MYGGAITCTDNSNITLYENSNAMFNGNKATYGGTVHFDESSDTIFRGQCVVTFTGNTTIDGRAAFYFDSNIVFMENSSASFTSNEAKDEGGAIYSDSKSCIKFTEHSKVIFDYNKAYTVTMAEV